MTPYWGKNFFETIGLLLVRLFQFLTGQLSASELASDEIQALVLIAIALSSALLGTFLILKRMTMLANSLSHTILVGMVVAYLLYLPFLSEVRSGDLINSKILLLAAVVTGLITTLLTQFLTRVMRLQEDASIGLVFTTLFALGVVGVTIFTRNVHLGTEAVLGNIDALHFDDFKMVAVVALINIGVLLLFFKEFRLIAFDAHFARHIGVSIACFDLLLMVLTAATSIAAFRAVGVILFLALLVGPSLTARLFTDRLGTLLLFACLVGGGCSLCGVALARHFLSVHQIPLSTSGLVVSLIGAVYLLSLFFAPKKGLIHVSGKRL